MVNDDYFSNNNGRGCVVIVCITLTVLNNCDIFNNESINLIAKKGLQLCISLYPPLSYMFIGNYHNKTSIIHDVTCYLSLINLRSVYSVK